VKKSSQEQIYTDPPESKEKEGSRAASEKDDKAEKPEEASNPASRCCLTQVKTAKGFQKAHLSSNSVKDFKIR